MNGKTASRPDDHNIVVGRAGEDVAAKWLTARGMTIVERNWRCRDGEIDIVAVDGDTLVVVEVKTRTGPVGGHPFEAITPRKVTRLRALAWRWCADHQGAAHPHRVRLDAVAVHLAHGELVVEHLRDIA